MKKRLVALALLAASIALPGMVSAATDSSLPSLKPGTFKPMFVIGPKHNNPNSFHRASSDLPQWNGSYTDLTNKTINFTQIGGDPATTNSTSTVNVLLIPVKFVITDTKEGKTYTFDPAKVKLANNHKRSVVKAMLDSPIFQKNIDFSPQYGSCSPNCVDLGKTQYEDAFQRGTWWGNAVSTNTKYHVILTTTTEKEQTIKITCDGCVVSNPFGSGIVGTYDINSFDGNLQTFMQNIKDVNPGVFPLFMSYDIYLTSGGCCIGGYHNANGGQPGGQTYGYATYVDSAGAFSQDVSAFTHEVGEWMDDPFTDNYVNCDDNSLMEVGDPLEGLANYGAYKYKDKGFTYNLQSLVYMSYFGDALSTDANEWYALQDDMSHVCPGQ